MPDPDTGLRLSSLAVSKHGRRLFQIDLSVGPGEAVTVMGPSGTGKSTLLAAMTGTLAEGFLLSGRIFLDGQDITETPSHRRRLGILFQDDLLFPHLSVADNLAFGLRPGGSRRERAACIAQALKDADLSGLEERDPATLSGGQKARVSLMRTLLSEPRALLLDEAFASLDPELRERLRRLVFERAVERRLPVLMVTHDIEDAAAAGGRIVRLGKPR